MERQRIYYGSPVKPSSERQFMQHTGLKGMKHGHQRYQINGKWTEEGLRRRREREAEQRTNEAIKKYTYDKAGKQAAEDFAKRKYEEVSAKIDRQKKLEDLNRQIEEREAAANKSNPQSVSSYANANANTQQTDKQKAAAEAALKKQEAEVEKAKADRIKAENEAFKNKLEISKSIQGGLKSTAPVLAIPFRKKDAKQNTLNRSNAYAEAHSYTDQELREVINRIRLENDYVNLTSPVQHSREEKAREVIEGLSSVVGLVTAGAIMISAIKKARDED